MVEDVKEEKVEETLPFKGVEGTTVADISKAEEMKKSGEIPSYLTKQRFLLNVKQFSKAFTQPTSQI